MLWGKPPPIRSWIAAKNEAPWEFEVASTSCSRGSSETRPRADPVQARPVVGEVERNRPSGDRGARPDPDDLPAEARESRSPVRYPCTGRARSPAPAPSRQRQALGFSDRISRLEPGAALAGVTLATGDQAGEHGGLTARPPCAGGQRPAPMLRRISGSHHSRSVSPRRKAPRPACSRPRAVQDRLDLGAGQAEAPGRPGHGEGAVGPGVAEQQLAERSADDRRKPRQAGRQGSAQASR